MERTGKTKVAIVAAFPPPPGGMPRQAEMLAEILAREGAEVVRINTNPFGRRKPRWRRFRHLLSDLGRLRGADLALVFAGSYASFFAFSAVPLLAARRYRVPAALMYKGGAAPSFFRTWGWLVRPCSRMARAVIVPGEFLRTVFDGLGVRAHVIPDVIDDKLFYRNDAAPPGKASLFVARNLEAIYGVDLAIAAFAEVRKALPEAQLHIAGDGSLREKLEAAAERAAPGAVHFHGRLSPPEIAAHYRKATVAVNPARFDNHPNSVIEAMLCGTPVVAFRVGGLPYLVEDGVTGYLSPPGDVDSFARNIIRVHTDPAATAAVVDRAARSVTAFYWPYENPGYLDLILEAVRGNAV
ncbi:MAG: glycosyltransferase family 4 protein [Candidatus Zixiibacteriota bacterium]